MSKRRWLVMGSGVVLVLVGAGLTLVRGMFWHGGDLRGDSAVGDPSGER